MNLAVIGSGGREHAICYKLKQSPKLKKLICIPGNAGTQKIAENIKAIKAMAPIAKQAFWPADIVCSDSSSLRLAFLYSVVRLAVMSPISEFNTAMV